MELITFSFFGVKATKRNRNTNKTNWDGCSITLQWIENNLGTT